MSQAGWLKADGTGERGQGTFKILTQQVMNGLGWALPVQNCPWPIIEHRLDTHNIPSGHTIKPGTCGKELSQEPVGVLVGASFPGSVGMRKVDGHCRLDGNASMVAHFLPLVIREGPAEVRRQSHDRPDKGLPDCGRMLGLQRDQQGKPRGPFDKRTEGRGIGLADEQVAFPMAGHDPCSHLGWSVINADHLLDGARRQPRLAGPPKAVMPPEVPGEGTLEGVRG